MEDVSVELSDIFYTSNQKKGHVRVELNESGFSLQRTSTSTPTATAAPTTSTENENTKAQHRSSIAMSNIVGGRCMRLKKSRRLTASACVCTSRRSPSATRVGESTTTKSGAAGGAIDEQWDADDNNTDASAYLYVFAYVLKKNLRNILRRERTVLTLRFRSFDTFEENMVEATRWYQTLKRYKKSTSPNSNTAMKRLLVFVNPKSGKGKAREMFNQGVAPVLNEAEVAYDLHVTRHANYAREFVRTMPVNLWSGIVAVGGDGLFFEVLNGLLQRPDWSSVAENIPLGIVPCGSGNGLARSIAHYCNEPYEPKPVLGAALAIVHCSNSSYSTPMDVVRVELRNQVIYSFLSVGWGLISDIDIESERLRALGYQRFTIWTLHRLISLRTYKGRISYLQKTDMTQEMCTTLANNSRCCHKPVMQHSKSCNMNLNRVDQQHYNNRFQSAECIGDSEFDDVISFEASLNNQSFRSRCGSWLSAGSRRSTYYSISESVYHSIAEDSDHSTQTLCPNAASGGGGGGGGEFVDASEAIDAIGPQAKMPPLDEPVPESWTTEEGDFVMVHAAYQSYIGSDCFFAPASHINDGIIYLVIIRGGISRAQLLNFMINMSSGTHLPTKHNEFIKVVPVTAFRIEPLETNGILTVDGELVDFGAVQGEMLPGIARVMIPK